MTSEEAAAILGPDLWAAVTTAPHTPLTPEQVTLLVNLCGDPADTHPGTSAA